MTLLRNTPAPVPWRDPHIPIRLRVIGFVAIILLFGLILWSALVLITAVFGSILASKTPLEVGFIIWQLALPLIGLIFGLYGWQKIRFYAFGYDDFRPRASVPPKLLGQPIDISMTQPIHGLGKLQFANDGIKIQAENKTVIYTGFCVGVVGDLILDLILFPINYLLFKRRVNLDLGYEQITEIKVAGRNVSVFALEGKTKATKFKVSSGDGERLYRELNAHYPSAIEECRHLLF